jgi:coenzyme F420-reducing hydrogenase delta subunit
MCSGRVDLAFVLRAFSNGMDGVFIGGCRFNDCNYGTHGNYNALSMVYICKKMMEYIGLNPERLRSENMSSSEGNIFAEVSSDFGKKVKAIGPLGVSEGIDPDVLKARLEAITSVVPYIRLVERERMRITPKSEANYRNFFNSDEFNKLFEETIAEKLAIAQIIALLRKGPLTTGEIANGVGLTPSEVSRYLNSSTRQRFVRFDLDQKRYALA